MDFIAFLLCMCSRINKTILYGSVAASRSPRRNTYSMPICFSLGSAQFLSIPLCNPSYLNCGNNNKNSQPHSPTAPLDRTVLHVCDTKQNI